MEDDSWRELANCRGVDPGIFFPEQFDGPANRAAKLVCKDCIVKQECLNFALETNEAYGIYGGVGPRTRRRLRKNEPYRYHFREVL